MMKVSFTQKKWFFYRHECNGHKWFKRAFKLILFVWWSCVSLYNFYLLLLVWYFLCVSPSYKTVCETWEKNEYEKSLEALKRNFLSCLQHKHSSHSNLSHLSLFLCHYITELISLVCTLSFHLFVFPVFQILTYHYFHMLVSVYFFNFPNSSLLTYTSIAIIKILI